MTFHSFSNTNSSTFTRDPANCRGFQDWVVMTGRRMLCVFGGRIYWAAVTSPWKWRQ